MKLRRAMAAAAATAVIAPVALLAAPAAYATDETTPTPSPSVSESTPETSPSPSTSVSESAPETSPSPSTSVSESAPEPSTSAPEESETPDPEPSVCEDTKVDVSISGLPGKIAAGSGWHKFSLNVANNSDSTLNDLDFFAGASPDKNGEELFSSKQVQLQAWDPQDKIWVDLNEGGYAVGYVGYTDELKPDYEVNIPLRLNVSKSAPVGAGFSLGATIYGDNDDECIGFGDVSYKFQIVAAGTDTGGTKPTEGGKAPVTDEKPSGNTPEVTGSLAETGSSSALPMISLVGGAAVVAGAGAIFVVRRRKAGVQA
ncbi:LAETG motif-containing sortase-dependent surface protein [Streptomyces caelestis]|uniref:LAETG motif-containing sortase-dependent surface protein n=1 Tax=Streptomyces caelestis TaxID=36816 RepID=UPI00360E0F1F